MGTEVHLLPPGRDDDNPSQNSRLERLKRTGRHPGNPGNSGGKPGRSGRRPFDLVAFARALLQHAEVRKATATVLKDADHPARPATLRTMLAYGYGTPVETHVIVPQTDGGSTRRVHVYLPDNGRQEAESA